jgi:hypothetical protein
MLEMFLSFFLANELDMFFFTYSANIVHIYASFIRETKPSVGAVNCIWSNRKRWTKNKVDKKQDQSVSFEFDVGVEPEVSAFPSFGLQMV